MVTQADIDNLNTAIANETRQVTLGGQSVTYRSIEELIKARDDMRTEFRNQRAEASGNRRPKQYVTYHGGRGY